MTGAHARTYTTYMATTPRAATSPVKPVPIMVRALLTPGEYLALRTLALQTGTNTQTLVGRAIRDAYDLKGQVTK